jgi:hypothetical protein
MTALTRLTTILIVASLAAAGPAAAQTGSATRPPQPHQRPSSPARPTGQSPRSDAQLEAAIRARLAQSKIAVDKFLVRVQGGVATIEGRTAVIQHKGVATRLAKSAGAAGVNNHVQIDEAARQAAAANLTKGRRRAQIKRGEARSEPARGTPRQSR